MKVIITGATGFIGGEVLNQCLRSPEITHIYTLSRRPLQGDAARDGKITSIILKDFTEYPEDVLEKLSGTEVCFWTLGDKTGGTDPRLIDIGYTQAAAKAFTERLQPQLPAGKRFRFVHTSGILSEKDPKNPFVPLWFLAEGRKSRGESELKMLEFGNAHADTFRAYVVRPGMVLRKDNKFASFWEWLVDWSFVNSEHLALAMLSLVDEAGPSRIVENKALVERGRKVLRHSQI